MMRCRCFFEYALSPNSCRKTLCSPPRAIQQQLRIWCRSSCTCLGRVFEVIQECAMCTICLTDAQQLPVPGAEENEGRAERGANAQTPPLPWQLLPQLPLTWEPPMSRWCNLPTAQDLGSPCPALLRERRVAELGADMGRECVLLPGAVGCRCPLSSHLLHGPSHSDSLSGGSLQTAGGRSQESPVNTLIFVLCHFRYRCGFG